MDRKHSRKEEVATKDSCICDDSSSPDDEQETRLVTPAKKPKTEDEGEEEEEEDAVTAETKMGFHCCPDLTNREIMLQRDGFVNWARRQENRTDKLEAFVEWADSEEGKKLELESLDDEVFSYGKHKGKKFSEIYESDPDYHKRFLYVLKKKGEEPSGDLERYIHWINLGKKKHAGRGAARSLKFHSSSSSMKERTGNHRFNFGQYKGLTFTEVAKRDPSYHLRLKFKNDSPNSVLDRYISCSPTRFDAQRDLEDMLARKRFRTPSMMYSYYYESDY
jgi:hypothetical protein